MEAGMGAGMEAGMEGGKEGGMEAGMEGGREGGRILLLVMVGMIDPCATLTLVTPITRS